MSQFGLFFRTRPFTEEVFHSMDLVGAFVCQALSSCACSSRLKHAKFSNSH